MTRAEIIASGMAYLEKKAQEYLSAEPEPGEHPVLTEYRNIVRRGELGGTGVGALAGGGLGLLGRRAFGKGMLLPIAGALGGGLLGKYYGRQLGEEAGAKSLEQATGIPWSA